MTYRMVGFLDASLVQGYDFVREKPLARMLQIYGKWRNAQIILSKNREAILESARSAL
jgi:hypothetical protein